METPRPKTPLQLLEYHIGYRAWVEFEWWRNLKETTTNDNIRMFAGDIARGFELLSAMTELHAANELPKREAEIKRLRKALEIVRKKLTEYGYSAGGSVLTEIDAALKGEA